MLAKRLQALGQAKMTIGNQASGARDTLSTCAGRNATDASANEVAVNRCRVVMPPEHLQRTGKVPLCQRTPRFQLNGTCRVAQRVGILVTLIVGSTEPGNEPVIVPAGSQRILYRPPRVEPALRAYQNFDVV